MKKKMWFEKNQNIILVCITSFVVLFMSVGFALYGKVLSFSGNVSLLPDGKFEFLSINLKDSSNFNSEDSEIPVFVDNVVTFDLNFSKMGDNTDYYVIYEIEVANNSSYDYVFNSFDFTPYVTGSSGGTGELTLSIDGIDNGDVVSAGTKMKFRIKLTLIVSDDTQSYDAGGTTEIKTEDKPVGSLLVAVNEDSVNLRDSNSTSRKKITYEVINTYDEAITFSPKVNNNSFNLTDASGGSLGNITINSGEDKTYTAYVSLKNGAKFYSDSVTLKLSLQTTENGNYLSNDFSALVDIYVEPDVDAPVIDSLMIVNSGTEGQINASFSGSDNSNGDITYTLKLYDASTNTQVGSDVTYTSSSNALLERSFTGINQGTSTVSYYATISAQDASGNTSNTVTSNTISVRWKVNVDLSGLSNVTASPNSTTTDYGKSYTVTLSASNGRTFTNNSVVVKMGNTTLINNGSVATGQSGNVTYVTNNHKITINNVTDDITITASSSGGGLCIDENEIVTLTNGEKKAVKDIKAGEMLLVWNMETGTYDAAPVVFNDTEERSIYSVMTLYFSGNIEVNIIGEHGFFDYDMSKYVYIDESNYNNYIGHRFVKYEKKGYSLVKLEKVNIYEKYTKPYSPVTFSSLNYYVNDMLSMPGGINGLFNIFDVDKKNMKYDAFKMQEDIRKYGLLKYEDYNNMFPEFMYDAFNGKYLNIAINKKILTWEYIEYMANRYTNIVVESNK